LIRGNAAATGAAITDLSTQQQPARKVPKIRLVGSNRTKTPLFAFPLTMPVWPTQERSTQMPQSKDALATAIGHLAWRKKTLPMLRTDVSLVTNIRQRLSTLFNVQGMIQDELPGQLHPTDKASQFSESNLKLN
jgi:hypothetical protein